MAKAKDIKKAVPKLLGTFLEENGLELYHIDYKREGKDWYLKVFIDKIQNSSDGEELFVGSDDCELVSRFLSDQLDEAGLISQNYYLMVSSPGMDRQLYEQRHFDRYVGHLVEVKLYQAVNKKKEFEGTLDGLTDGHVVITDEEGNRLEFPLDKVVRANLAVVF